MERKIRAATVSGVFLLVIAAVLVAVNVVSYPLSKRFDLTKNEQFTLSKGSARLVNEGLKENLAVTLYVTRGLPKYDVFVEDLVDLIKEYEKASGGKLKYTVIEPKTDEEREKAKEAGLQELQLGELSEKGDQATIARGFMGILFEYGSEKATIPVLSPDNNQGLEFWITNKIREIRDKADDVYQKVGVIDREGVKLSDSHLIPPQGGRGGPNILGILQQALPFYKVENVDLQDGDAEIDPELRGVIVLQADKDFTEKELQRIDQFVMRGDKSLLVIAGAVNMKPSDATMMAELNTRGLDKLTSGYGIEMKKEAILDWGRSMSLPVPTQSGQMVYFRGPGVIQLQADPSLEENEQMLDNAFAGFFRLDELAFPFASPLLAHPEKQPQAKFKTVARSSPVATVETSERIDMKIRTDWAPKGEAAARDIAITAEGKLKAAFAKGSRAEGIDYPEESVTESRVLVIAAPQFLANPFARAGNPPPMPPQMAMMGAFGGDEDLQAIAVPYARKYLTATILAFKNLLDWMANDKDLMAVSAKLLGTTNLTYSDIDKPKPDAADDEAAMAKKAEDYRLERQKVQNRVQWTLTLFPPILFVIFGLLRWRWRENRRAAIKV